MPENTLGKILRANPGLATDFRDKLRRVGNERWLEEFKKFLRGEPCWTSDQLVNVSDGPLLSFVCEFDLPRTTASFKAAEMFVVDMRQTATVLISDIWPRFVNFFLKGRGKVERPLSAQKISCHTLNRVSRDGPIMEAIGSTFDDHGKHHMTLSEVFVLLRGQRRGADGVLLTNGKANVFYIVDRGGKLRAVSTRWRSEGWAINASEIHYAGGWAAGTKIFTRTSIINEASRLAKAA